MHRSGTPWAFPKPSAICPEERRFFDVARPRTRPVESKTGPPELPGLIGAVKVKVLAKLLMEEIIPVVKTFDFPNGEPKTPTHQPCRGGDPIHWSEGIAVTVATPATSLEEFQETIFPGTLVPLDKTIVTFLVPIQSSITW